MARAERAIAQCENPTEPTSYRSSGGDIAPVNAWRETDNLLCIDGGFHDGLGAWLDDTLVPDDQVVIRSVGGLGREGILAGEAIKAADASVIVWDYCLSACANGPVLGAKEVLVPQEGFIAWHGGLPRNRLEYVLLDETAQSLLGSELPALFEQFRQTGQTTVPDALWLQLPEEDRARFDERAPWRERSAALVAAAGVHPDFLAAGGFASRHAHPGILEVARINFETLDVIAWSPLAPELEAWGLEHVIVWGPETPRELFDLGVAQPPRIVLNAAVLEPGDIYRLPLDVTEPDGPEER